MAQPDFSIADVLAWARTKPADEAYNYVDSKNCAMCQFLRETQRAAKPSVSPDEWSDHARTNWFDYTPLPAGINAAVAAIGDYCAELERRWTFGGLVRRLEALLPAEPISDTWTKADAYLTDVDAVESVSL